MSLYISEQEMIQRYGDGLAQASDRAKDFLTAKEVDKPRLFVEFIHGLKVAAGSAHQLSHQQENPHFLTLRDLLEKIIEIGQTLPTFTQQQNGMWMGIKKSLDEMAVKGKKMATSKSVTRTEVLDALNLRQIKLDADLNG